MTEPRKGDTIISKRGKVYWCEDSGYPQVSAVCAGTGRPRKFSVEKLECIDHDDGLWAEMERPND